MERHGLLVRHREDELPSGAVGEPEELRNHDPAGLLPQLGRRDHGHEHLLAADRVHLVAHDPDDLLVHAPAARQERPQAGAHLPDQPGPGEELVGDRLGVSRVVPEGREEQL